MSERQQCGHFRSGRQAVTRVACAARLPVAVVYAAFAAILLLGLSAQADEIEPEPEPEPEAAVESTPEPAPKAAPKPAPQAASEADGFRLTPEIGWSSGDHNFEIHLNSRFRWERWQALRNGGDNIFAFRNRVSADYTWKNRLRLFAEGQHATVFDLDGAPNGAAGAYRGNAHNPPSSSVDSFRLRQLFGEARLDSDNWLRVGRQDMKNASAISYEEGNWKYLKNKRLSQRLVGGVGWTHGERSYDGVSARMEQSGHVVHLYAAEPTTGVFEIDRGYKRNKDIIFGGLDWTVERGTWFDNTELGAFFVGFSDDRKVSDMTAPPPPSGGFFGEIEVYTFGFSSLGVYPVGPGNLDLIIWGAMQIGQYFDMTEFSGVRRLDQVAGAGIVEAGYQLPDVWAKPWLRTGVNFASGDSNQDDGNHNTFFNIMPTNHLYYGYADQLAFANLIDLFVQLKLSPIPKLGVELVFHQFWLYTQRDSRYFGSGAFAKRSLGYGKSASNGANNVGQEIDFVLNYQVNKHLGLMAGVAHLFGGKVMSSFPDSDANWAFFQVALSY